MADSRFPARLATASSCAREDVAFQCLVHVCTEVLARGPLPMTDGVLADVRKRARVSVSIRVPGSARPGTVGV